MATFTNRLREYIKTHHLSIVTEREIPYARQFKLSNGTDTCVINIYTTGKVTFGGKDTPFKREVEAWSRSVLSPAQRPKTATPKSTTTTIFTAHIGADESGKGDYFGPLVVAAVHVTEAMAHDLTRYGVRDSKALTDDTIADVALQIRERCPDHRVKIVLPAEYNALYESYRNLNTLLADQHADIIRQLVLKTHCRDVLVDQFAAPRVLKAAVVRQNVTLNLMQRTKAESDVAVAAASILARESFVATIADLRAQTGLEIPLGASARRIITIGREILKQSGRAGLERVAKLHFKTTQAILDEPGT